MKNLRLKLIPKLERHIKLFCKSRKIYFFNISSSIVHKKVNLFHVLGLLSSMILLYIQTVINRIQLMSIEGSFVILGAPFLYGGGGGAKLP